jgi:pimeloyl-ACP methyl ester carboxylesterase
MKPDELKVKHRFVDLPGLRMHYVECGQGPLVVLLHGFPENWWSWRYQLEPLAQAGFRVVAPDLRGYGETDTHGPYDLDTLAGDVCHFIAALGEQRAKVVGHDWGGAVAWHLAAKRPEFCERLVVMNCPHPVLMRERLLRNPSWVQLKKSWYFFFFLIPRVPEWLLTREDAGNVVRTLKASSIDRAHLSPDEVRPFRDAIQRPGTARAMVDWYRTVVSEGLKAPFSAPAYDDINANTLLIWGMRDPALGFADVVPGTERYVRRFRIERVPDCGHFVQSERPEAVNRALAEFLSA